MRRRSRTICLAMALCSAGACGFDEVVLRDLPSSVPNDGGTGPEGSPVIVVEGGAIGTSFGVYAGQYFTCLLASGVGHCWGSNVLGALGTGDLASHLTPARIAGGVVFEALAAGEAHTCGLERTTARVFCWGSGAAGQLGLGDKVSQSTPHVVPLSAGAAHISVGYNHSCAVLVDGSLWCWGANFEGELGQNDRANSDDIASPSRVGTDSDWMMAAGGQGHTCGVRRPGSLWCWGRNGTDELGLGAGSALQVRTPTRVGAFADFTQLDAGQNHSCALRADGSLWCWGRMNGTAIDDVPTRVGTDTDWRSVSTDVFATCGIKAVDQLHCWGRNDEGQLGLGDTTARSGPTQVAPGTRWASAAVGRFHTCAETIDHVVRCTGAGENGQLGLGDTARRSEFTAVVVPAPTAQ